MKHRQCFENAHCSYDCPNFQIDIANERYGYGIADDMRFEKVNCKDCHYNSGRCDDCLFEHSKECPEYSAKMMKQLKPCPFCGSKNVYMAHIGGRTVGIVCCPDCNLDCTITRRNASAEKITDKWNRRQRQSERGGHWVYSKE